MNFDFDDYLEVLETLKAKVIDDTIYAHLVNKVSLKDSMRIFKKSNVDNLKMSYDKIESYETKYRVFIPEFLKYILTAIGSINSTWPGFIDRLSLDLREPVYYMSDVFFSNCVLACLDENTIDNFCDYYDVTINRFSNPLLQSVFEQLNSDDDVHIMKLLFTGCSRFDACDYVILNKNRNGEIVIDGGWAIREHTINEKSYYQYTARSIDQLNVEAYCLDYVRSKNESLYSLSDLKKNRQ